MERVSMNDGLDGRETVAFGLGAGELAVVVVGILAADALLHSGMPGALRWLFAVLVAGAAAALGWGRLGGRPLLEWTTLAVGYVARTRGPGVVRWAQRLVPGRGRASARGPALAAGPLVVSLPLRRGAGEAPASVATGAVPGATARPSRGPWVVAFFSLAGGSGRTTLAIETAVLLATRHRVAAAAGRPGAQVALLDLCERNPSAALRLGVAPPLPGRRQAAAPVHPSGLLVLGPPTPGASEAVAASIGAAEAAGAGIVVVDVDCDLGERCRAVLQRCDRVVVLLTPTVAGVLDAYRSTAALRRLGLRDRLAYCGNRWHPGADLSEAMADLRGRLAATVPEDRSLSGAEQRRVLAGAGEAGDVARAIGALADAVLGPGGDASGLWRRAHAG